MQPSLQFGDASAATSVIRDYVAPLLLTLSALGAVAAVGFLVVAGYQYITAAGNAEKMQSAKTIIKRALIGLVLIVAAATLVSILSSAYSSPAANTDNVLPPVKTIQVGGSGNIVVDAIVGGIKGLCTDIITSVATPIIDALNNFSQSTPLVASNKVVFDMWRVVLAVADALLVLIVAALGFHVMSSSVFGFEDLDLRQLLPRFALAFVVMNTSIFAVDMLIGLSNAIIAALKAGFPAVQVWDVLKLSVALAGTSGLGIAVLLVMLVFVVIAIMLLIYYIGRLVTIYLGAILAPIVTLLWLLPPFRETANMLMKTYVSTIFVLFIHIVILQLAACFFAGVLAASPGNTDPFLSMLVGIAALVALLKAEGVMTEYMAATAAPKAIKKAAHQVMNTSRGIARGAKAASKTKVAQAAGKAGKTAVAKGAKVAATKTKNGVITTAMAASTATSSVVRKSEKPPIVRTAPAPSTSLTALRESAPKITNGGKEK